MQFLIAEGRRMKANRRCGFWPVLVILFAGAWCAGADEGAAGGLPEASIDGEGVGWRALTLDDFENVNCAPDTWSTKDGLIASTGEPVGVIRSKGPVKNFDLVVEWRHLKPAGNSGVFVWVPLESLEQLNETSRLPSGIEVQILDHGYAERYEQEHGKKSNWFTTHGDVFSVGTSSMKPFPWVAPDGRRSFPRRNLSKGVGEWNHYYVRAINGEVRLWVNGTEVSGGTECMPAEGYLCLESEGSPVEFRNLRIREVP
jgi:hypothetical protein